MGLVSALVPSFLRPAHPNLSSDPEEQQPLQAFTTVEEEETDEDQHGPKAQPKPRPPSAPSPRTSLLTLRRAFAFAALIFVLYHLVDYLYSDPARWSVSWKETFWGASPVRLSNIIHTPSGRRYEGVHEGDNVVAWKGIRYALPPTGPLRFRDPVPVGPAVAEVGEEWEMVNATSYDDGCPRKNPTGEGFVGQEDCLSLNVHSPVSRLPDVLLPVMVWIHGGGFTTGAAHEVRYEPRDLIERSIQMNRPFIYVSIGYRLHALGFSASPPIPGPPPFPPHVPIGRPVDLDLNVGFKDQIEALQWIRREIEHWGGDKEKVTLMGHSAGAISVGLHQLYSPPDLFRGAFMLSGAPTSFPVPWPHDAAARTIHPLPGPADCPSPVGNGTSPPINSALIDCLRELPLDDFMHAIQGILDRSPTNGYFPWLPVLEGEWEGSWLDVRPSDRITRGTFSKIPVVLGSVRDEGTRFVSPEVENQQDITDALRGAFEFTFGAIETILTPIWEFYPDIPSLGSPYQTGNETFGLSSSFKRAASIFGDVFFQAPRRHFLRETPKDFGAPSWNFFYDEKRPVSEPRNGAQHGADVPSWFGHPEADDLDIHHLSRHMVAYLINFITNLDPNGPGLRPWPHYGLDRRTLHLGRKNITLTHDNARLEGIRFINTQNPIFAR